MRFLNLTFLFVLALPVTVMAGEGFARLNERGYAIRPNQREDYDVLFEELYNACQN